MGRLFFTCFLRKDPTLASQRGRLQVEQILDALPITSARYQITLLGSSIPCGMLADTLSRWGCIISDFLPPTTRWNALCFFSLIISQESEDARKPTNPKMKLALLASLLVGATAFAPSKVVTRSSALKMAFEDELGVQEPLGFFDPFGMLADADVERFERLRYVELKHGRISMLAVVGYLVTAAGTRLPGDIDLAGDKFAAIPAGFAALTAMPSAGLAQIIAFIGALELGFMKDATGENEFPGDFRNGFIDFGWDNFDEETKLAKRAVELNQGRAAQMGILALMVHEKLGVSLLPESAQI